MAFTPGMIDCITCGGNGFLPVAEYGKRCADCHGVGERKRLPTEHSHAPSACTCADIGFVVEPKEDTEETRQRAVDALAAMNAYLANFVAPVAHPKGKERGCVCFHCGEYLTGGGLMGSFFGGGFEWGLAHGEGHCSTCGWPARAYHFNPTPDVERFTAVLSYLPAAEGEGH